MHRKAALLTLLIVVLVLVASGLLRFEYWRVDHYQREQLSAKTHDLEQVFRQYTSLPAILSKDPRLINALSGNSDSVVSATNDANQLLSFAAIESQVAAAFLMDRSGLTIASSNFDDSVSFVGKNYGFRPYFTRALQGNSATFFAVGATTGIPGYFVSEPISKDNDILGVLAVKLEEKSLPASWFEGDSIAIVTDELGVSILSTKPEMLYSSTPSTNDGFREQILLERRYQLSEASRFEIPSPRLWRFLTPPDYTSHRVSTQQLNVEPWSLHLLMPHAVIYSRVMRNFLVVLGLVLFAGLLLKIYRQQVQLSNERALLAEKLKIQIDEKTNELQNAQSALIAESNFAMLGRMSAAINHEINQPLASLRLNLASLRQLIERDSLRTIANKGLHGDFPLEPSEDTIESTVVDLDRTAKRITRVIETLRSLPARQKSGFDIVNVNQVLANSVAVLRQERKLLSRCVVEDYLTANAGLEIRGHSILLQQAILNLLYNALDAVADISQPWVGVSSSAQQKTVIIEISDNGAGVDPAIQSKMFEPFQTSPDRTTGMGLGLTLALQIIADHGGSMQYRRDHQEVSDRVCEISIFSISLPILVKSND